MALDIKKYMSDLVRQLNLRHMDEPTRAQLADWKKKGVATSKQEGWDPDAELPDINSADYRDSNSTSTIGDDYHKIMEELVLLARDLTADSSLEDNKDVQGFLKDFYGDDKAIPLFAIAEIPEAEEIAAYIEKHKDILAGRFKSPDDLDEGKLTNLENALRSGNYKKDPKAHKTLQAFLSKMQYPQRLPKEGFPPSWKKPTTVDDAYAEEVLAYITESDGNTPKKAIVELLEENSHYYGFNGENEVNNVIFALRRNEAKAVETVLGWIEDLGDISLWPKDKIPKRWKDVGKNEFNIDKLAAEKQRVENAGGLNEDRLEELEKQLKKPSIERHVPYRMFIGGEHAKIFDRIISKDKLRDAVTAHGGDIAKWISAGLKESNYKDGDDKVGQKFTDRKRLLGRAESAVKGYLADTWDKLSDKHKRHIYQTKANFVVEGLLKEKVKPTDGLGKVLEKLDGIADKQPVPVQKQIKWMKKTLGAMSNTTQFKEALTHGGQMQNVVNDIIAVVASDSDMENAMMTLETLAVMSSSMTTSGVREELHKMDFTIFSDPSMSFNKGGLGVLTKAIDKTLRFATLAVYEAGNFVANAIKKTGGKIKKDKINAVASGQTVTDDEMRRIQLMAFWNFINSNANTDINIYKRHSEKQKTANAKAELKDDQGNPTEEFKFKIKDRDMVRKNPTAQEVAFLQYMIKQGYAQAA